MSRDDLADEPTVSMLAPAGHGVAVLRVVSPVLVGRARELEGLVAAMSAPPAVAVVEGEAGVGKSRLVDELLTRVGGSGLRVLRGGCPGIREPFPLGPVVEAVRGVVDELVGMTLTPATGALRPLLPELADALPPTPPPLRDATAERHRVFRALREVLAAAGPLLVVLEDLHWADVQTVEFLGYLLGDAPAELSLVATYRSEEATEAVRALGVRLPAATTAVRVALAGLETGEVAALAAAILGSDEVSGEFAGFLRERTGGLPFAIEEVLALLRERGDLVRMGGRWARRGLAELGVPAGVRDSVLERAARLRHDARAVVDATAVLQTPAPEAVVIATAGVPAERAVDAVAQAVASGLVRERSERLAFRHVLAAEAVYEALPGVLRRRIHARAADVLFAQERPPLGQLAHHLRRADRMSQWALVAEQAADQAVGLGDDTEAARLLRDLLAGAPLTSDARSRVARKLGSAALHGMAHGEALELLSDIVSDDTLPRGVRGELRLQLALLRNQSGDYVAGYRQFEQAVPELEGHPAKQARAMAAMAVPNVPDIAVSDHLAWMRRSVAALGRIDDPVVETAIQQNRAALLITSGDPSWRESLQGLDLDSPSPKHERARVGVANNIAISASYVGFFAVCEEFLPRGRRIAERLGYARGRLMLDVVGVGLDFHLGRWQRLDDTIARLRSDLRPLLPCLADVERVAGCLALARGDLDDAHSRLQEAVTLAERHAPVDVLPQAAAALARVELARGEPDRAAATALRGVEMLEAKRLWSLAGPAVRWATEALTAQRSSEAASLVRRFARGLRGREAPLAAAALLVSNGVLAEAAGENGKAARLFLHAAEAYAALPCPYEAALARERAGGRLAAAGDDAASDVLLSALAVLDGLGASWDAARCARVARGHGVRLPVPHRGGRRGYGDALSPREREVAESAAAGLTNKEIAAKLFLSPATVSSHLTRAMRKLGVHSRRAIAARLAERDG